MWKTYLVWVSGSEFSQCFNTVHRVTGRASSLLLFSAKIFLFERVEEKIKGQPAIW